MCVSEKRGKQKLRILSSWKPMPRKNKGRGFTIYIKKYLKAKEELWKLKHFTMQKYNLQKIL